ncbi:MAG: GHMP kinase [Bacteroidota bacterium]|nr:MAG: GHMP kinase [Bacteroidota bacterium]
MIKSKFSKVTPFYHRSNGKILFTGEYLVMHGAQALALPVRYGQTLEAKQGSKPGILIWKASDSEGLWFEAELNCSDWSILETSSMEKAQFLIRILQAARILNPLFLKNSRGIEVSTMADFPVSWGLGTSSTLIHNIATWAGIDSFSLHQKVSKGSGYDIACAQEPCPLLYKKISATDRLIIPVRFKKDFLDKLYFVYSGEKISTEMHLSDFVSVGEDIQHEVEAMDKLTQKILCSTSLDEFMLHLSAHEKLVSRFLKTPPIAESRFTGFDGTIKSLGAWGGDFLLAATQQDRQYVERYFEQFSLSVIIPFSKMIL